MLITRRWLAWRFINLARMIYPASSKQRVWQIIEVPRRLSEREAADLADQVENL
jgi:hypothetical protein